MASSIRYGPAATTMTCFPAAVCACLASTAEFALAKNSPAIAARLSFEAEARGEATLPPAVAVQEGHEGQALELRSA